MIVLALILCQNLYGQKRDTAAPARDTLTDEILIRQSEQFRKLEALRIADSIKRTELEHQLQTLRFTDNLRKEELLTELETLRNRDSLNIVRQKEKIDSLRGIVKGFPVIPFTEPLFHIYIRQGSLSPKERADIVTARIRELANDYLFRADSLKIVQTEEMLDIAYKDRVLIGISDNDALWMNTGKEQLAEQYKTAIGNAVVAYIDATSWQTLLYEIGLALLVIVAVFSVINLTGRLYRWFKRKIITQKGIRIKGLRIRNYELLDAGHSIRVIMAGIKIVRWVITLLVIYMALLLIFGLFPWTKNFSDTLLGYFLNPLKKIVLSIWDYIPNLITILVILLVFRYVMKGFRFLKQEIEKGVLQIPGFYAEWANPTYQIIRILALAFMMVVIFPYMPGSDSPVFQGVSVFIGVLFTFGSAGALGNLIAGLVLTYMRAYKIGDQVKIGDVTGDIIERSLLATRIRTIKNEIISIPNSTVMNSHTINYSSDAADKGLILHTTVTIGYETPWQQVHTLLKKAALATNRVSKTPEPFVVQLSLDNYYVVYQINAYTHEPNLQADIYSELRRHILDVFNEAGIELMSPQYHGIRDANDMKMPADHTPPGDKQ